ncbi:unnamed protein product [Rangifer tarandus platyrhynchus]|uniref:Uncharacterized protein n=1 Tax=Rangifer tarandus platyrhynchus TaxID=3082113 RepID=A0ABN8XJC1_RANTA|nr:unnamed protein product [Rangifer tarandus platyrhynchus]
MPTPSRRGTWLQAARSAKLEVAATSQEYSSTCQPPADCFATHASRQLQGDELSVGHVRRVIASRKSPQLADGRFEL